jgi:tetratricopeptide (TPR) repeat protein
MRISHRFGQGILRQMTLHLSKRELSSRPLAQECRTMEHTSLQQGIEAAQRGDRERAYLLIRQAILEDAQYAPAWYYMSFLLDDIERQREYLEWALKLEPNYTEAQAALEQLRIRQVLASARSIVAPEYRPAPRKIGDYLVDQGLISAAQRDEALAELSKVEPRAKRRMLDEAKARHLGDILLTRGWLTPQQLADALVRQQQDRSRDGQRPERLGEYLMAAALISNDQLGSALAEQSWLRMRGKHMRLGELMIRGGALAAATLSSVLEQQRQDFSSRYGNI